MKVTVVISAYTEERWIDLTEAVASMWQQTRRPDEVMVVIDHNDKLLERTKQHIPNITLMANVNAQGCNGVRNTAIVHCQSDIIAFMDEDAVASPTWLERILAGYQQADVIGVGGGLRPLWMVEQPRWLPEEFYWTVGCSYKGMPEKTAAVRNMIGCNMSYRLEAFKEAGMFLPGIGRVGKLFGCDETELCIRVHQELPNTRFLYDPEAYVRHRVTAGRATWNYFFTRCYGEGISKAVISNFIGTTSALSNERTYTFKTLPIGFLRGFADLLKGDIYGPARSFAIASGLLTTTYGYIVGKLGKKWRNINPSTVAAAPKL